MSKISVIVPVYKVEQYLDHCVQSVLVQSFENFELILVDDGSPDRCPTMCDNYAKQDPRVHVIHQKNGGLSAARNAGIDYALSDSDSEWLTFIDSDDWVHPRYLEWLYQAATENDTDISVCGFERTAGADPSVDEKAPDVILQTSEEFYVRDRVTAIIACAKLYKKELFQNIRYPINKIHEDEFVTYRVLFGCSQVAFVKAPLYAYYQNENSIMHSSPLKKEWSILQFFQKQRKFFKKRKMTRVMALQYKTERYCYVELYELYLKEKQNKSLTVKDRINAIRLKKRIAALLMYHFEFLELQKYEGDDIAAMIFPIGTKLWWKITGLRKRQ